MRFLRRPVLLLGLLLAPLPRLAGQPSAALGTGVDKAGWDRRFKLGASSLLGIPSFGVERPLARPGRTFQWDVAISPWASVNGYPFQLAMFTAERRAYREATGQGWYAGLHLGVGLFRLQRWDYSDTTIYHEGGNFMVGGSFGHVWRTRRGTTLDVYAGAGTVQSAYKSYDRLTGSRNDTAELWNLSGEWLPYRTGIAIGIPRRRSGDARP